jgi:hypothetical protein
MSAANINTSSLNQLVDLVNRSFLASQGNQLDNVMLNSGVVRKETIPQWTGLARRFAESIAITSYSWEGVEGSSATQAIFQYGYEKDLEIDQHDLAISITLKMRTGGKDQEIIRKLTDLWWAGYREIDLNLSHRLGFAWSTSYVNSRWFTKDLTCGDGLALISTAHTLTGSASTYSNQIPNNPQFSKGAYTAAKKIAVENTLNNIGEKMALDYNIVITTDDEDTIIAVKELSNATADITSSNAGTYNVYKGLKHVIAPRIATTAIGWVDTTKRKYWFLWTSDIQPIIFGELTAPFIKTPRDGNNGEDAMSGNWNFVTFSFNWIVTPSPRGIIWSKGTWEA